MNKKGNESSELHHYNFPISKSDRPEMQNERGYMLEQSTENTQVDLWRPTTNAYRLTIMDWEAI
jgi:hypothetical protein